MCHLFCFTSSHTHTHTVTHTHTHCQTHTHTHTHTVKHTHIHTHTHTHTLSQTHTLSHTHTYTHTYKHTSAMAHVLVAHGADINLHGGSDSWTPLFYAAMAGEKCIRRLHYFVHQNVHAMVYENNIVTAVLCNVSHLPLFLWQLLGDITHIIPPLGYTGLI